MNRYLRDLLLILVLAALWAGSGYAIGVGIEAMFKTGYAVGPIVASLNVILGLSLFLGITNDPTAERIFFEGPRPNEPGLPQIGCLWILPLSLLVIGLMLWFVALLVRFIFPS